MLSEKLHPENPSIPADIIDPDVYTVAWATSFCTESVDLSGLPSLEYAIYLYNTVKFHLGQTYRLFDESEFEKEIRAFYASDLPREQTSRLWITKFFMILAFGTAFHSLPTTSQEPPGGKFFKRAMALVPDTTTLWKNSLLAIEVLGLIALYLFCLDDRESANIYVS